jgi:hypothetical protein
MEQILEILEANIYEETLRVLYEQGRPSVLFKPTLGLDGNRYFALYGTDLMSGIAGFGETADAAMRDFDNNWVRSKAPTPAKCKFCGRTGQPADANGYCSGCVRGMARTNGD